MLLNFQKQFAPYILDGSKAHTIRGERKDGKRPKPGEMLHLYTGLRRPGCGVHPARAVPADGRRGNPWRVHRFIRTAVCGRNQSFRFQAIRG